MSDIKLSADQQFVYDKILSWIAVPNTPILTIGGFAGVGKSLLVSLLADTSPKKPIAFVTFTGKAASVLKRKLRQAGVKTTNKITRQKDGENQGYLDSIDYGPPYCGTIHSLIYKPIIDDEGSGRVKGWELREELDRNYRLLIIDESSCVSDDMLEHLRSFDIPILAVGDHGQLPPVGGIGSLAQHPDLRLERIHRQAAGNPIIALSKAIREKGDFDPSFHNGDTIIFDSIKNLSKHVASRYIGANTERLFEMTMICYTNRRRLGLNLEVRKALKFSGPPKLGEQIVCLKNESSKNVYNGMRGVVTEIVKGPGKFSWLFNAVVDFPEDGVKDVKLSMCIPQFLREKTFSSFEELSEMRVNVDKWEDAGSLFDLGYAMTAHKFMGSQADDVLVIAERPGPVDRDTWKRWCYVAATRAVKKLTVLI
jgi:exodeoxyribonuclease V